MFWLALQLLGVLIAVGIVYAVAVPLGCLPGQLTRKQPRAPKPTDEQYARVALADKIMRILRTKHQ